MSRPRPAPAPRRGPWLAACLAVWLAAMAAAAAAQTVPVRSGAHDGFDRLVLDMPARTPWRIERRADGASVILDGAGLRFDLGAVFERIDRRRLRAISAPDAGRLDLAFACACETEVFWHAGSMLVIDISDPTPEARDSPARPRPVVGPLSRHRAADGSAAARRSVAGAALVERLEARIGPRRSALPAAPSAAAPPDAALGEMRAALQQQLGRAASQGLVTPDRDAMRRVRSRPSAQGSTSARPSAPPDSAPRTTPAAEAAVPGLRVTTSMDSDMTGGARPDHAVAACPPQAHIDVAAWGGAGPFAAEVAQLNGALFGEFDTVQAAEALRLARLYIHHGFGAEARQVLGWLDAASPEVAIARELAVLVDTPRLPPEARLAGVLGCGEPGVLWAILATPELPEERVFDHRALRRAFVALPDNLRRALGPVLVRRLVAAGHDATADALLRQLRDGDALADAETGMARAALAESAGEDDAAQTALREVTRTNAVQTGAALAATIERALAREAPVAFDDAQLAGALAFEHRGTPLGARLSLAYLSALAASGAFAEAMAEFDRLRPSLDPAARADVASVLARYVLRQSDDVTFLRAMMADRIAPPGTFDNAVSLGVARRLLDLGFPAQAARHVAPEHFGARGEEREASRLLRARIALAQDRPAAARREVLGLSGDEADLLRAEAQAARGDHADARRLFAARDAARRADRARLHLGEADILMQAEDPDLRQIGEIMAADAAAATAPAAGKAAQMVANRALLERSTALRGAMEGLLAATPAQPARP